jgi:hypothetical protein
LGSKLALEAFKFCPLVFGINTGKQHSTALLEKLGWKLTTKIPRYSKLLFPGEAVREITKIKFLRWLANLSFAPFRPNTSNLFKDDTKLRIVKEFDSQFDHLWNESAPQWSCGVVRNAAFLKWQYREQPGKKFEVVGYFENGRLRGYAVLFFRKKNAQDSVSKVALTDICYHPERPVETIDALLRGALQLAVERCAGTIVTDVIDSLIQQRLEKFGFWQTKNPLQLLVKSDDHQDLLYNPANWFLTRGDADISIFEHPNL